MACPGRVSGKVSFLHFDGSVSFVAGFRKLQGVTGGEAGFRVRARGGLQM